MQEDLTQIGIVHYRYLTSSVLHKRFSSFIFDLVAFLSRSCHLPVVFWIVEHAVQ